MLREHLILWREQGDVIDIRTPVDARFEAAAIAAEVQAKNNKIVVLHQVRGYDMPVVMNIYSCRKRLGAMIGADGSMAAALDRHIAASLAPAFPFTLPVEIPADSRETTTLSRLPILTYHEEDAGAYITTGIVIVRDPETGAHNLSFHRCMIVSDTEMRISIGPRHDLGGIQRRAEEKGLAVDAVFLVGAAPELFLAACTSIPPDADELALAASIAGGPIAMRTSLALGMPIPVESDIVIEGRILPNERRKEAPFGEWMGYYIEEKQSHVFEVLHVDRQRDGCFQGLICGSSDDLRPLELSTAARIYKTLRSQFSGVLDVACHPTMLCTVIQLRPEYDGQARQVLMAAITAHFLYSKLCVVVNEDVDIYDLEDVFWAYVTRARPDERTVVLGQMPGFYRDPHKDHWGRLALDATIPWGREHEFRRKKIPGRKAVDLTALLQSATP